MPDDDVSRDVASTKVCGELPETKEKADDKTVTEGNLEESSGDSRGKERLFDRVESITSGPDLDKLILQIPTCMNIPESPSTLPEVNIEATDSKVEWDEDTDHTIQLEVNLPESFPEQCAEQRPEAAKKIHYVDATIVSKGKKGNLLSKLAEVDVKMLVTDLKDLWKATSPAKTGADIDAVQRPMSEMVNPNEYNIPEQRVFSAFERECSEWKCVSIGKSLDLLAETEESYLTLCHKNVKHLKIINLHYNLISKYYKPQVAIVRNRYRIIIDVSSFDPENIVVHLVGDRINVYASGQLEDNSRTSIDFHKVYKVPERVNKEKFKAHMLNPLKLLCICAPLELSVQDENAACTQMEM